MNRTVFIVTIFSIVVFAAGAWFPADADFARLLALCSFSMSIQIFLQGKLQGIRDFLETPASPPPR